MSDKETRAAVIRLASERKGLEKEPWVSITVDDAQLFKWQIALLPLNDESSYFGGYFKIEMTFTKEYPYKPPTFKFLRPIFHPNIYSDGKVCISILHPPGADEQSGEHPDERWSPLQGVESILRSVLLLLDDPETTSPANVDANVMYRFNKEGFAAKAKADVEVSKKDIPAGFIMPKSLAPPPPAKEEVDDDNFWQGSESDEEMNFDDDDDEGDQEFDESGDEQENEEMDSD